MRATISSRSLKNTAVNKAEKTDRLVTRTGLSKSVAGEAVDGVSAAIGAALANGEQVRIGGGGARGKLGHQQRHRAVATDDSIIRTGSASRRILSGRRVSTSRNFVWQPLEPRTPGHTGSCWSPETGRMSARWH